LIEERGSARPHPQLTMHPYSKRYALPPFLRRRGSSLRTSISALHYYTKTKYYAILLKKS
jgi:hypothetical protein